MHRIIYPILICAGLLLSFAGCQKKEVRTPEQIERDKTMAVENLLRNNQWGFYDLKVSVQYESRATPLLAGVADENGMVQPGVYDSYDIFGNNKRQLNYIYEFTRDKITLDTLGTGEFTQIGGYYVINPSEIRINPKGADAIRFEFQHLSGNNLFVLNTANLRSEELLNNINTLVINSILADKPSGIASTMVDFMLNNEKVQAGIQRFLYDLIHGKIEEITQTPEELSEKLARALVDNLKEIDWETLLYDKIVELLEQFEISNPEETAIEIAERISEKIEASLTQSDIYELILPIMENIENEKLPVLASQISAVVYQKFSEAFSDQHVYDKIFPVWEAYTQLDSATISETADTLAGATIAHFFNQDTLIARLIPFVTKIDETGTLQLGGLAQEIIDLVLIPVVENINNTFPGLNLQPDWASIKPYITSVLTALKAAIGSSTTEELAETLANAITGLMNYSIQQGFEAALLKLQEFPPDQVADIFAAWISNLVEIAEQPVVDFIENKLNGLFTFFKAEEAAQFLSEIIHSQILLLFSEENLYQLFLPILEKMKEVNKERVAEIISDWILEMGLVKDNITEEQVVNGISQIIELLIGNISPEKASQQLTDLILNSDLLKQIDGNLLKVVLEIKLYNLLYDVSRDVNAITKIEISIQQK